MSSRQRGFTLIELLVVVAIVGILAAIAIPNFLNAMNRSRQKRSMADIRTIATAWESRATDVNTYTASGISWPAANQSVTTLEGRLMPTYIKKIPVYDGWGALYAVGATPMSYSIISYGSDKQASFTATSVTAPITTQAFDCDLVFTEGNFVVYPEGAQGQ
jgi:general secretion pathway protein G